MPRLIAALGLWLLSGVVWAQSCNFRFAVTLADDSKVCLMEFGIAERSAPGRPGRVGGLIPASGNYTIVATPALPQCAPALGFEYSATSSAPYWEVGRPARRNRALAACQRQQPDGSPLECACRVIVEDGTSELTRGDFERYAGSFPVSADAKGERERPPKAVVASQTAPAPAPREAAVAPPATSNPSIELAEMRRQLEQLRSQVGQSQIAQAQLRPPLPASVHNRQTARALVIGNAAYKHLGVLANPRRDATDMASKLRSFGIEVDLVLDADRNALVKALADHQRKAVALDVNIFYYAGHGLQVGGVNYIAPVDMLADGISAGYVKLNGVALNDALEYMPARTRLVFLDACRDNPASRSLVNTRSVAAPGLAPMAATSGTLISYATRDGAVAEDGRGRNSPYTAALLRHLDAPDDIAVVLRRVRQSVMQTTDNRQEPWEYGSLVGDQLILQRLAR